MPTPTLMLKLHHFLFRWYYKRVPDHFRQYTLLKSIARLIQNYEHQKNWFQDEQRLHGLAIKENDALRSRVQKLEWERAGYDPNLTMKVIQTPSTAEAELNSKQAVTAYFDQVGEKLLAKPDEQAWLILEELRDGKKPQEIVEGNNLTIEKVYSAIKRIHRAAQQVKEPELYV